MPNATYEICVDWDNNSNFTGTYDDITADVKSIHFSRGKSDERGKAEVGQCSITVNNAGGKYTPSAGGVISALLLPKRPIRIRATDSGTTYNLFYGYIEEIIPHPHLTEQDCIITAVDGLDFLSRNDLETILVKDQQTGYLHKVILNDSGWPNGGIVTDGLVLNTPLWQYDLNGSTFYSKDIYRYLCTVTGAVWGSQGRTFDNTDDLISIATTTALDTLFNGGSAFTVSLWFKNTVASAIAGIWTKGIDNAAGWTGMYLGTEIGGASSTDIQFGIKTIGAKGALEISLLNVQQLNTWQYWTVAYDGSRAVTGLSIYLNNVLQAMTTRVNTLTGNTSNTANLILGKALNYAWWFGGIQGEVLAWNRKLTSAEDGKNYLATKWFYDTQIDDGQDTVPYWYGADVKSRFAQGEIDDSEQGFSYINGSGYFCFEDRNHRSTATHQTSQGTFDNTMAYITYNLNPKNVYNIVKVTVTPWELQSIAELWRLEEIPLIPVGETLTWWGEASVSGESVFVEAWTTPVITTDYTANSQADGLGIDMTSDISIVTTTFAQSIKLDITNNGTVPAYITLLKARGTYYNPNTKVTRKAEDTTSQIAYQKRTLSFDGKYIYDTTHAQDLASYAIGKYKDPRAELSMTAQNKDAARLTQILAREISDRITIKNTKLGITSQDFFIDYMEHDISISGKWHTVIYRLADCINEDFWCLGFSGIGDNSKLGY